MRKDALLFLMLIGAGVAQGSGKTEYTPPVRRSLDLEKPENSRLLHSDAKTTWKAAIQFLSGSFFVLDQVLQDSALVNLSFSADDPQKYIECGRVTSWVKNLRGRRDYAFEAASRGQQYEVWPLKRVDRTLSLTGKVNVLLIDEPLGTRVRVTARYVVEKNVTLTAPLNYEHQPQHYSSTLSFTTDASGRDEAGTVCQSNFAIEIAILDGIERLLPPSSEEAAAMNVAVGSEYADVLKAVGREKDGYEKAMTPEGVRETWVYRFPQLRVAIVFVDGKVVEVRKGR